MKQHLRQVVLDTETTGLVPKEGHRIIEIGCVELINRRPTQNHFHVYINPDRIIDDDAIRVHGITNEFLLDKPRFNEIVDDYIAFTKGAELIIHNAPFDVGFLDHEFGLLIGEQRRTAQLSTVFDTLVYARKKYPGARNSLDALCKRFGIDNSHRELHGALLDAEILAEVYVVMTGGQASLLEESSEANEQSTQQIIRLPENRPSLKVIRCTSQENDTHDQHMAMIDKASGGSMWNKSEKNSTD